MKTAKIITALSVIAAFNGVATAQSSNHFNAQMDAVAKPCGDVTGATSGLPEAQAKAVATAALPVCYNALKTLEEYDRNNGHTLSAEARNYFNYIGGKVILMTAASETLRNNGQVNHAICGQVNAAESIWATINAPFNSQLVVDMQNNQLRKMLAPVCNAGPKTN